MGSKGSQTGTTSSGSSSTTTKPDKNAYAAYLQAIQAAQQTAKTPYTPYGGQMVAGFSPDQLSAMQGIDASQGIGMGAINQGEDLVSQGSNPYTAGNIQGFMNPYQQQVTDATMGNINETNAEQQQQVVGNSIMRGAFGGDRSGIAQSELARQQGLASNATLAGLNQSNYAQAVQTAGNQGQMQQQGGTLLGQLGALQQGQALQGLQAQMGSGSLQQQQQQANLNVPYSQYLTSQAWPYQNEQFLAGIAGAVGPDMGGKSTTQYSGMVQPPVPSMGSQMFGAGMAGLGAMGQSGAFGSGGWLSGMGGMMFAKRGGGINSKPIPQRYGFSVGGAPQPYYGRHYAEGGDVVDPELDPMSGADKEQDDSAKMIAGLMSPFQQQAPSPPIAPQGPLPDGGNLGQAAPPPPAPVGMPTSPQGVLPQAPTPDFGAPPSGVMPPPAAPTPDMGNVPMPTPRPSPGIDLSAAPSAPTADLGSAPIKPQTGVGDLTAKYESSGNWGSAHKDNIGWSYGRYQFNSQGSLNDFMRDNPQYAGQFAGMSPGSEAFNNKWRELSQDPDFRQAQDKSFVNHAQPALQTAAQLGYKLDNRGVEEAILSGSIQHGGIGSILKEAAKVPGFADMSPQDQLKTYYAVRSGYVAKLNIDPESKKAVLGRYPGELKDALAISGGEGLSASKSLADSGGLPEHAQLAQFRGNNSSAGAEELGSKMVKSPWMALTAAGLGIMAGKSPYPLVNIGEGGLKGIETLQHQQTAAQAGQKLAIEAARQASTEKYQTTMADKADRQITPFGIANLKTGEMKPFNFSGGAGTAGEPAAGKITPVAAAPLASTSVAPQGGRVVNSDPTAMLNPGTVANEAESHPEIASMYMDPKSVPAGRSLANTEVKAVTKDAQAAAVLDTRAKNMRHNLDVISNFANDPSTDKRMAALLTPGVTGEERQKLLNWYSTFGGKKVPPEVVAAVNSLGKDSILGGFRNITNEGLSAREAQPIIKAAMGAMPSFSLPEQSSRVLLASMESANQRQLDRQKFIADYRTKNGGFADGWEADFNQKHPPESYVARAIYSVLPEDKKRELPMATKELRTARDTLIQAEQTGDTVAADKARMMYQKGKTAFDRRYGGLGNYIAFGTM